MALSLQSILSAPVIELDSIDSTNNYAMGLIDADTAQPGLTVTAKEQTRGKGQRGRTWIASQGESLLMSIIIAPLQAIDSQFLFNVMATVGIADVLQELQEGWDVRIKWPNDIIINDKKAGGVLIENVIRGSNWAYSIVGIGINVLQPTMPRELPYAGSLRMLSGGAVFDIQKLTHRLRERILTNVYNTTAADEMVKQYNDYLYRKGLYQQFDNGKIEWSARIESVKADGQLVVTDEYGRQQLYTHGVENWKW
ncbi:MAG: biotin--[acetyl-CoA-carboxylase] ligase [Bacteroidetes bacterium]|nr:biotin--[acetyl-CoA-carboxylase] ligase [Bacteroidota bacterium]